LKSATIKLEKVGKGKEFNIWYLQHSTMPQQESLQVSITSEKVRAANSYDLNLVRQNFETVEGG
jgi:hypothetical protein